jgi:hypothetical protein
LGCDQDRARKAHDRRSDLTSPSAQPAKEAGPNAGSKPGKILESRAATGVPGHLYYCMMDIHVCGAGRESHVEHAAGVPHKMPTVNLRGFLGGAAPTSAPEER